MASRKAEIRPSAKAAVLCCSNLSGRSSARARVIDAGTTSFIFEITGKTDKVEQFIALMVPLGLVEVARTGVAGITRGAEGMKV